MDYVHCAILDKMRILYSRSVTTYHSTYSVIQTNLKVAKVTKGSNCSKMVSDKGKQLLEYGFGPFRNIKK
jgi:hypothetical protein